MTLGDARLVMPVMQMTGITKRFGTVVANDDVNFDLRRGEIHALVGENGAGKTTLMRMLYGMADPDSGEIHLDGERVRFARPSDAIHMGIGMVHQHFMLVPSFTVAENVTLGIEPRKAGLFDHRAARAAVTAPMERLGLAMDPDTIVGTLNVASQQKIEIVKVLHRGARIIILDEPTAVLTPQETEELFVLLKRLAADGSSIIFITHKLREVFAVADRITVLRGGRTIDTMNAADTTSPEVVAAMTGRTDVNLGRFPRQGVMGPTLLSIHGLRTDKPLHDASLQDVTFDVRAGEVLGVAGVEGNGQSVLAEALVGTVGVTAGTISLAGRNLTDLSVYQRRDEGLAYVPEDRQVEGLPINASVVEGLAAGQLRTMRGVHALKGAITGSIRSWARDVIRRYDIKAPSENIAARQMSGGNQQKVVLARELESGPNVLILAQPTRGVDLGAIDFIYKQIMDATERGCAVVLISADLDELLRLADRIIVMFEGHVVGEARAEDATREGLGLLMTGSGREAATA